MAASFEKFNYLIRPAKQVERKLLLEGLHRLAASFPIRDYRYVGFGSPFYADFVLFHKFLYMDDLVCVERAKIKRRMKFNKPFPKIRLKFGEMSAVIPTLDRKKPHVAWLDYDYPLNQSMLADLSGIATTLCEESVVLITVDADPRVQSREDLPEEMHEKIIDHRRATLESEIGRFVAGGVKRPHISRQKLPELFATVVVNHLRDELAVRSLQFFPLFNFAYADGRQMLSLGGMIGAKETKGKLDRTGIYDLEFINTGVRPTVISVPPLTARERLWLDQHTKSPSQIFEVEAKTVSHYRQYYRHYPSYFEALL